MIFSLKINGGNIDQKFVNVLIELFTFFKCSKICQNPIDGTICTSFSGKRVGGGAGSIACHSGYINDAIFKTKLKHL